jgi:class 3 adenylate cyclase
MPDGQRRRERKVVSVLFCDLVGFTQQAEAMDPEDVEALLRPYHQRVRSELERHGGTVEKFIGDAVMALFGAPVAHEDDPERAVRAALAIREFALEEALELRVGVTTGEALVSLDASPGSGEGMASGDVVNTAARLQAAARVNGILVDETTYRATRNTVDYDEAMPVEAKGKAEPIAVWHATAARSRFGVDVAHEARAPLVGRERELTVLSEAFARARHEHVPQLVTLVGVPGIGKSRLVYELSRIADADPDIVTWRQGRSLAYGDGVTLWALGEIVKAQAGILEQDDPDEVRAKIHRAVEDALPGSADQAWVESHVLSLVGLADEAELGGNRRTEAFAAWRRFLEGLAEQRPMVLVFEDLHWADESLLDFVDELVEWVSDVPLLVVATARPELLERRRGWGGGKLNSTTLALTPLTDDQTALLIGTLLAKSVLEADSQQALLERAGGNPLYAEQFADLYVERGSTEELPLPETLQGIIAARLDELPEGEKGLLQDAAVVGKVFWASVLYAGSGDVASALHALERKGFIRRQKRSSLEGESEFSFAHALVRDVAYAQIARPDRAEKHRHMAEWIEGLGRSEDHAELLAHHWRSALDLVRASGGDETELEGPARRALRDAGDRAYSLNNNAAAAAQYEFALALWPEADRERVDLLFRRARALYRADDDRAEAALEAARDELLSAGDTEVAGEAESFLANVAWERGHGDIVRDRLSRAEELVGDSVSPSAARVLTVSARMREIAGDHRDGRRLAESALAMAERLGLDELRAHALTTLGMAKEGMGDLTGRVDMEEALDLALEIDSPTASGIAGNLAVQAMFAGHLDRADELWAQGQQLAERFGDTASVRFYGPPRFWLDYVLGRWNQALEDADAFIAACETGSPHTNEWLARMVRGSIREARGDAEGALADHLRGVEVARGIQTPVYLAETLAHSAATHAERGEDEHALTMLQEVIPLTRDHSLCSGLALCGLFADRLGVRDELRDAIEKSPGPDFQGWRGAFLLVLAGDLRGAADHFAAMGNRAFEARQRFHAGQRLIGHEHRAEGETELQTALAFYRSVDATYFAERAEQLLAQAQRASA